MRDMLATWRIRLSISSSNSSSEYSWMGFFAPPCSVFLAARRTIISRTEVRIRLPGGDSKYCLSSRDAKPLVPPK